LAWQSGEIMTSDWQSIVTWGIVALAIAYLTRVAWQTVARKKATACGGGCKSCAASAEPAVVEIGAAGSGANGQARHARSAAGSSET
jgi:hypothetical protein